MASGCAPLAPVNIETPFDASQHRRYAASGSGTITGSLFSKTVGGDVKIGAGEEVALIPDTPFFREAVAKGLAFSNRQSVVRNTRGSELTDEEKELGQKCLRIAMGNGQGLFRFSNLPAGKYIILGSVYWQSPGDGGYLRSNRGLGVRYVTLTRGGTVDVVLYAR